MSFNLACQPKLCAYPSPYALSGFGGQAPLLAQA